MSLHINRFIDTLKATEARGQRDIHLSLREAKDLVGDITKLLLTMESLRDQITAANTEVQSLEINGGSFKNS